MYQFTSVHFIPGAVDLRDGWYELAVLLAIFRGRYREGFATARPIEPGKALPCDLALLNANHVFQPGHRVMVQVQSNLFPLYDRRRIAARQRRGSGTRRSCRAASNCRCAEFRTSWTPAA